MSFRSQKCKADLIKQGCVPKKSLILTYPTTEQVPKELTRHFIRGYFDGDGWFTNTPNSFQVGWIGTKEFISGSLKAIDADINKTNKIFICHREDGAKRYVMSGLEDVYIFLNYLCRNSNIYLDRKYKHYIDFITNGSQYHQIKKLPDIEEIQ